MVGLLRSPVSIIHPIYIDPGLKKDAEELTRIASQHYMDSIDQILTILGGSPDISIYIPIPDPDDARTAENIMSHFPDGFIFSKNNLMFSLKKDRGDGGVNIYVSYCPPPPSRS